MTAVLTRSQFDRQAAAQALKARAAGSWMTARLSDSGGDGIPGGLRREVSAGPQDRAGTEPGADPVEVLRGLQVRQVQGVITQPLPGPEAWADLELPLPGPGPGHTRMLKGEPVTPQHAACEAAVGAEDRDEPDEAERRRLRVQHEADPYSEPAEAPEVAHADLSKVHGGVYEPPASFPVPGPVCAAEFRRPLLAADHDARSPGYEPPRPSLALPEGSGPVVQALPDAAAWQSTVRGLPEC